MRKRRLTKTPGFFWQGTLIVLPVVLLAAVGLLSLRQDKALATQEAKERAQALADEASQRIWDRLTAVSPALLNPQVVAAPPVSSSFCLIQVDNQGNLLFPPPYTATPLPRPLDVAELNEQQADLWQAARAAEYDRQDPQAAAAAWRQFIEANPPGRFGPAAQFALGLALAKQDQWKRAFDTFGLVGRQYPNAIGESGLPLKPLADLQCLTLLIRLPPSGPVEGVSTDGNKEALSAAPRLDSSSTNRLPRPAIAESERPSRPEPAAAREELDVDAVCRDALEHPSMVTPLILEMAGQWQRQGSLPGRASNLVWATLWERHELARRLYKTAAVLWPSNAIPRHLFWLSAEDPWLAVSLSEASVSASNAWLVCRPEAEVQKLVGEAWHEARPIPDYLHVTAMLAGRQIISGETAQMRSPDQALPVTNSSAVRPRPAHLPPDPELSNPPLLATASKMSGDVAELKVAVHLANASLLYARQRSRTLWFGTLIAVAALAGFVGLLSAWRAFRRQLRLSEMKSNFVSSVSHELRAPIASVRLMAEGLQRGRVQTEEKKADYFRFIVQECRRLSALIENVLDFARIEQGRKQYELEPTDVQALVQQTVVLMEPYAAERQVQLVTVLAKPEGAAADFQPSLDGRAIQQALVNLISNALKHSPPKGAVTVGLEVNAFGAPKRAAQTPIDSLRTGENERCTPRSTLENAQSTSGRRDHSQFQIWVEDHGAGIPPEEHERIFERFYRRGAELRRETEGVGIGLSIVKHIVEAHGGRVIVRSAVGQGSRFTIEIPC